MAFVPIDIPPGCVNVAAKAARQSNWREAHLIRWDQNTMRPIGGWTKYTLGSPFASPIRAIHRWIDNSGQVWTAFLCEEHCYVETSGMVFDITPDGGMSAPPADEGGYGDEAYGMLLYGTPRPGESLLRNYTPAYSIDNWGEELRVMTSVDGRLLGWAPTTIPPVGKLEAIANAPTNNRSFVITPERHIILFGMGGDFDKFGWSDEEDDTNWSFADILSRAGFYEIQPKSPIVASRSFFGGTIMFTPANTYIIRHIGLPYVYAYEEIGKPAIPISAQSVAEIPEGVIWPSINGFWLYNGVGVAPIQCDIWDWITEHADFRRSMFFGASVHVTTFSELWWLFTDKTSADRNTKVAIYNYREHVWSMANLSRSCGCTCVNDSMPIMSDGTDVFMHEEGLLYPGAELPWIETFPLNSHDGAEWITVKQLIPNISGDASAIKFNCAVTQNRVGNSEKYTPLRKIRENGYVDIRETGRDVRIRISMVDNKNWGTVGPVLADIVPRGRKMVRGNANT